jgi:nicotinate-nucleotide--dimethylbenzimidazole phosphoribosyltransferase
MCRGESMERKIWTRQDIEELQIREPSPEIYAQVKAIWDGIAKPLDGLGQFEVMLSKVGAIAGTTRLCIDKKVILTMCADNGIVAEHISQSGQEVTRIVAGFMGQQASSVGKMAARMGADVIPVDVGINTDEPLPGVRDCKVMHGTRDFYLEPAMTEEEALAAVSVGIDLVRECKEKGYQLIGTGEMGIGNTTTSSAVVAAMTGCAVAEVTGRGAGLNDEGLAHKRQIIEESLAKYPVADMDALRILATFGGLDIAGMAGVCIGGAIYHVPVVLDGLISSAAALVAQRMVPGVKDYLLPSHYSKEPAAKRIAEELELCPVIDAGLGLGEGTGAVMLFSLLDLALALYAEQTTFDHMEIEQYERY